MGLLLWEAKGSVEILLPLLWSRPQLLPFSPRRRGQNLNLKRRSITALLK